MSCFASLKKRHRNEKSDILKKEAFLVDDGRGTAGLCLCRDPAYFEGRCRGVVQSNFPPKAKYFRPVSGVVKNGSGGRPFKLPAEGCII